MTTRTVQIEGGNVLASLEDRTLTGLLLPYGEEGRTNVGRFTVEAGAVTIPADPNVAGLNLDHDRFQPVGRATRIWEEPAGVMATFEIARTPEGDAALTDPTRRCLSAEFTTGIKDGKATGGRLVGAALVARGAFPSAQVLAEDTPDEEVTASDTTVTEDHTETVYTDEDGHTYRRVYDATTTTIITPPTEQEHEVTATATTAETTPTAIPPTQRPDAPKAPAARTEVSAREVFAAFAAVRDPLALSNPPADAVKVLAALSDITTTGLLNGGQVARPNWLGQLYQGIPYEREYITLGNLGTDITYAGKQGYTLHRGTAASPVDRLGGTWAGNKTEIPSGTGFTKGQSSTLARYAFGADIAREFFDLPGGEEAIEAFFRLVLEDHLIWADERALATWRLVAGLPIAPATYPSVDGHDYENALGQVIQGLLAVKAKKSDLRRDTPTFIIANQLAYEQLIYTPKDLVPEFVSFTASTDWQGTGDGLRLVVGDTGIESTSSVIVGAGKAVEFDELPGGPLHIDALDLARGGVDRAIHGYLQTFEVRPEAVVQVGTPDNRANATAYKVGDLARVSAIVYQAVTAGTTSGSAPTAPAVGATVVDGTVTWRRLV